MMVVWQRLILRLFGQYMRNAVRDRALLGEQQGEEEEQRQYVAKRLHDADTLTKVKEHSKRSGGVQNETARKSGRFIKLDRVLPIQFRISQHALAIAAGHQQFAVGE